MPNRYFRNRQEAGAKEIALAVPVGAAERVSELEPLVEELVCLSTPTPSQAVGLRYEVFDQTSSEKVKELLPDVWGGRRSLGGKDP